MNANFTDKIAPFGYITQKCRFVQTLGEGGNGVVDLVRYNGRLACLKIGKGGKEQIDNFMHEAFMMIMADGAGGTPRVIMVASDRPGLLITYCPYPSLLELLQDDKLSTAYQTLHVFNAVTTALSELHSAGISHNDFKLDNVLVDLVGPKAYIIDLGMACPVGRKLPGHLQYFQDTTIEDHKNYPHYDLGLYLGGPAMSHCDVYSLGVAMRAVLDSLPEYDHELYRLCKKMTCPKGSARPTLARIMYEL